MSRTPHLPGAYVSRGFAEDARDQKMVNAAITLTIFALVVSLWKLPDFQKSLALANDLRSILSQFIH